MAQKLRTLALVVCACLLIPGGVFGQTAQYSGGAKTRALITQTVDESRLVKITGNTRPEAIAANDRGAVADSFPLDHMWLQLKRPAELEQELVDLIDEMHRPGSPQFHKWLTAAEFGQRFGVSGQDIGKITGWLSGHGFTVDSVVPSGMIIEFSGNAGQVRNAFHTEIHNLTVDGASHIANMSDPQIPAALQGAVQGVVSLHNFRPHTNVERHPDFTFTTGTPAVTYQTVSPADLAKIYNLNPLFANGVTGNGQTIVVLGDSFLANVSDVATFRSAFGLTGYSGTFEQLTPTGSVSCSNPGVNADEKEAAIDAEWASAAAPGAAIILAACADGGGNSNTNFGGFMALENLINDTFPPSIISLSYSECESFNGTTANQAYSGAYQQAVTLGISLFVAAGDFGAAECDAGTRTSATNGIAVSGFASTPYNVAVGATDFSDTLSNTVSTYWNSSNTSAFASALSYIPEIPWNNSCSGSLLLNFYNSYLLLANQYPYSYGALGFCNSATQIVTSLDGGTAEYGEMLRSLTAGGGGPSNAATAAGVGWPQPSWQTGVVGLPTQSGGVRSLPDVALFGGNGQWNHFYVYCLTDVAQDGGPCTYTNSTDAINLGGGGTSYTSPIMAGIMALVDQYNDGKQGNPNPRLYAMAAQEYGAAGNSACNASLGAGVGSNCIFNDVTKGDIVVDCTGLLASTDCFGSTGTGTGNTVKRGSLSTSITTYQPAYAAGTGWDYATGLGSVNAYNLVLGWQSATTVTSSQNPSNDSTSVTFTATITSSVATIIGTVTWSANTGCSPSTVTGLTGSLTGTATCVTSTVPAGTNIITAAYSGDSVHPASTGTLSGGQVVNQPSVTITFNALSNQTYGATPFTVSATASDGLTVSFNSQTPATCNVSVTTVTLVSVGACTIQATHPAALNVSQSFNIGQATASVTPAAASKAYGAADPVLTGALTGFVPSDNVTATYTRTAGQTAGGAYTISGTLSPAGALSNYSITYNTAAFTINKATASVTPAAASKTYGAADPVFTGTLTGFIAGDNVSATYTRMAGEASGGVYTISATLNPTGVLSNYTITYNTAAFTINQTTPVLPPAQTGNPTYGVPTTLTVTINAVNSGAAPTGSVTFQFTSNNIVYYICANGAVQTAACSVTLDNTGTATVTSSTLPAGTDGITATYSGDGNYSGGEQTALNFTVSQANSQTSLSLTPNTPTPTYGDTLTLAATVADNYGGSTGTPTGTAQFAYSLDNGTTWINLGSAVTLSNTGTAQLLTTALPAGTPEVRVSYSGDANFSASSATVTQALNQKALTVSGITAANKPHDGTTIATLNTSGQTLAGVVNSDNIALSGSPLGAFIDANAGSGKTVNITGLTVTGSAAADYTLTQPSAMANITTIAASATPNAASKTYGSPDPAFTGTLTGFIGGDNVTAIYTRTTGETAAGAYTISATLSPAGVLSNYTITSNTAAFIINKATASVTPAAGSKTFGAADPVFTGTLTGFIASDNVSATYTRTAGEAAGGTYTINATLSPSGVLNNYTITSNPAAFTINKASASVILSGLNAGYTGSATPVGVATTPAGLSTSVTYNGSTTVPSASGSYAVVATVTDPNYTGSASGTLTISLSQEPLSVTAAPAGFGTVTYAGQNCVTVCTANYNSGTVITLTATPNTSYTFSGWSGACSGTGACSVTMDSAQSVTATFAVSGSTSLTAALGTKSGTSATRVWPVVFTGTGPGTASNISITSFTLTRTAGTACTPVVGTAMPVSAGTIAGAGTATANVTIDFTGCDGTSRFRLVMGYAANSGGITNSATINNQFQ